MQKNGKVIDLHSLKLVILPGRIRAAEARTFYQSAYDTWKIVWEKTLLEVDGSTQLFSDHFTRQDYMVALFHGHVCVGLCCFRRAELWFKGDLSDSWFKPWPLNLLTELREKYQRGVVVSWLTIHPDYRRTIKNDHLQAINASARLCESINFFLQSSDLEIAFGITRNERSVNKMAAYTGFEVLQSDAVHHGEKAELIIAQHQTLQRAQSKFGVEATDLWDKKVIFAPEVFDFVPAQPRKGLRLVG